MVERENRYKSESLARKAIKWGGIIGGVIGALNGMVGIAVVGFGAALIASRDKR